MCIIVPFIATTCRIDLYLVCMCMSPAHGLSRPMCVLVKNMVYHVRWVYESRTWFITSDVCTSSEHGLSRPMCARVQSMVYHFLYICSRNRKGIFIEKHKSSFKNIVLYSTFIIVNFTGTSKHGKLTIAHGHYNYTLRARPRLQYLIYSIPSPRLVT